MDRNKPIRLSFDFARRVALRKESVDRNSIANNAENELEMSLSARRAWIEIFDVYIISPLTVSRSPQGERG